MLFDIKRFKTKPEATQFLMDLGTPEDRANRTTHTLRRGLRLRQALAVGVIEHGKEAELMATTSPINALEMVAARHPDKPALEYVVMVPNMVRITCFGRSRPFARQADTTLNPRLKHYPFANGTVMRSVAYAQLATEGVKYLACNDTWLHRTSIKNFEGAIREIKSKHDRAVSQG